MVPSCFSSVDIDHPVNQIPLVMCGAVIQVKDQNEVSLAMA